MKLEIASHHIEHMLWLQSELKRQDSAGKIHPVYTVLEHHAAHGLLDATVTCRAKFLTRYIADKFITSQKSHTSHRLEIVVEEAVDNPEVRFMRELILDLDLTAAAAPTPAPARIVPPSAILARVPPPRTLVNPEAWAALRSALATREQPDLFA